MHPHREELLFQLVLSKTAAKRAAWLDAECEGDLALRARLDALLVRLYETWEKPEKLAEWKQKLAAFEEADAEQNKPVLP